VGKEASEWRHVVERVMKALVVLVGQLQRKGHAKEILTG
jgi:hypothetical protein